MKHPTTASVDEAIEASAAAWLAERESGFSSEDERAFSDWRAADPRHAAAVARIEGMWDALKQLRDYRPEAHVHPDQDLLRPAAGRRLNFPAFAGLAGAMLMIAIMALFLWRGSLPARRAHTYATTNDGFQRVALADGSVLELNANTEVSVRLMPQERHVQLLRGEAHFKVAKDVKRPFWVEAGAVAVRAVGTAFDVRLGEDKVEVLVTEGKVHVATTADHRSTPAAAVTREALAHGYDLVANQLTTVDVTANRTEAPAIEQIDAREVGARLAWQEPRLVFVDTPLAETVAQFNRHNRVQIVLADPALAALPVVGTFRAENVDAFVRLIATPDNGIAVDRPDTEHIVLHRAK